MLCERPWVQPEVYEIASGLYCLYLGRDVTPPSPVSDIATNWVDLDWKWGVCSYVIVGGGTALVFDTGVYSSQGMWIRSFVERELRPKRILVVDSHWHLDHVSGNAHFADCPIIATMRCRDTLSALQDKIESASLWGEPAVSVVLPNITFADELRIQLGRRSLHLRRFDLHTPDSVLIELEGEGICLCSDMLEDTVPFVTEFDKIPVFARELSRLRGLGCDVFYPCHGNPHVIENGGYGPSFIDAMEEYYCSLEKIGSGEAPASLPLEECIAHALSEGAVSVWEPYRSVHAKNREGILASTRGAASDFH